MPAWSQTFTFLDGEWLEGNRPIVGARTHAFWLASSVFDGARAFEGVTPDLDKHCARLNRSAKVDVPQADDERRGDARPRSEGVKKFSPGRRTLYPPDVLARRRSATSAVRAGRGFDPLLPLHLRGAAARADRRIDHPLPLRQAARRHHADRRQGGLSLSQQRAGPDRSPRPRLRQLPHVRHARQRRRAGDRQRVHGQGRRGDDADRQRIVPERRHPAAGA